MSAAADRMKAYRERQRRGQIVVPVAINDVEVCEALVAAGFLSANAKDDRQALARAIERLIEALAQSDA